MLSIVLSNCRYLLISGDIFQLNVTRTWEFNPSFPVRSVVPIYIVVGLPLFVLRALSHIIASPSVVTWYSITVSVRCLLTFLSYFVDYGAYKLSRARGRSGIDAALVVASSYVAIVFYSRPFSNTIESLLFALLLYVTFGRKARANSSSVGGGTALSGAEAHGNRKLVGSSKSHGNLRTASYSTSDSSLVALIIVTGVFNRPTFVVFAAVPWLTWVLRDIAFTDLRRCDILLVAYRCFFCVCYAAAFAVVFVICDSVYFGRLTLDFSCLSTGFSVDWLMKVMQHVTVTPVNFFLYNTRVENLAEHGVHPRIMHFLVNIPLLFGIIGLYFIKDSVKILACALWRRKLIGDHDLLLVLFIFTPVALLSVFPHQEPRFLIPLLLPFAVLYASKIFGDQSGRIRLVLWAVGNVLGCLIFGALHQGGVVRALGHMQLEKTVHTNAVVIFWHTYMPPKHLLLVPDFSEWQTADGCEYGKIELHDFAGRPFEDVASFAKMTHGFSVACENQTNQVMLIAPGSQHSNLACRSLSEYGLKLEPLISFWPHISTEYLPHIGEILCHDSVDCPDYNCRSFCLFDRLVIGTSLNIYMFVF